MDHPLHSEKRSDNTQDFTILNIGHALAHTQVIATLERGHLPENLGPYTTNYEDPVFGTRRRTVADGRLQHHDGASL